MDDYKPSGDFAPAFQAAVARARAGQARQRGSLAEATRNVRTSGVRFIPRETLERGFSEADAGLVGDFSLRDAEEKITDRRRQEDFQFQREMGERESDLSRTIARRQLQGDLWGAGIGLAGGAARSLLRKYYQ